MKTTVTAFSAAMLLMTTALSASADDSKSGLHFGKVNTADSLLLAADRPAEPHEIPVPKFAVKSDNGSFIMTIGGQINPIMGVDLGNNLYNTDAGISFVTQNIPVPATPGHKSDIFINPLNAAIDFQIVGLAGTPDQITGYVKFATNGNTKAVKMSKAYVSWRGITAGLKNTLLQDGDACQPPTIDPEGPSGIVGTSAYEVGYKSKSYDGFKFGAAIDIPTWDSSNGIYRGHDYPDFSGHQVANYGDAEQVIPDIPAWIQYQASPNNRIRLSGILRNFAYRDLVANKTRHMAGWGVMLSGNYSPTNPLIFYLQAAYGHGIGAYIQDIAGMPLSFIPDNARPGRMSASPMMGAVVGLTYNINSRWQVNAMFSESRIWDVSDYATVAADNCNYKYALYAAGNVFYNITPYLQWGLEYVWGHRQTWNMGGANDSRIQTQLMFTI